MDVAHLGEEVVLDLVVQAATEPSQHTAAGSKVGGCAQLMGKRVNIQHGALHSGGVVVLLQNVGRLKNHRQNESRNKLHHHPSGKDLQPMQSTEPHGQHKHVREVGRFGESQ